MQVINGNQWAAHARSCRVAVGNFDGLHLGHRQLVSRLLDDRPQGELAAVVTFEPLPQAFFRPGQPPARLTSARQKLALLEQAGVDLAWVLRFNARLAGMPAAEFVSQVLVRGLGARRVVIGDDFRFGRNREGDAQRMTELGIELGFETERVPEFQVDGERVSSSTIRRALAEGRLRDAEKMLGRPFEISGVVIEGTKLGRKLGYPTANLAPEAKPCPLHGVFAVTARWRGSKDWQPGVASLGVRPAVGGSDFVIEVHIFDRNPDLYGKRVDVRFVDKIREEMNFDSLEDLVRQMKQDEAQARSLLMGH